MKDKIIKKASELFLNLGFKSITMDDIAKDLGISKKTIYLHFDNKLNLVEGCVISIYDKVSKSICEITKMGYNAIEENFVIKNRFKEIFEKAKTSPMYQLQKYYPKIYKKLMADKFKIFEECVGNNIIRGIKEGLYRKDIDQDLVLKLYFVLAIGIHDDSIFNYQKYRLNKLEIKALEYHTRAIATAKGIEVLEQELNKIKFNKL